MSPSTSTTAQSNDITVFCGSSPGNDPTYLEVASSLARAIAQSGKTLIYGGGTKGLMGQVARVALENGGKVHGIIPSAFLSMEAPDRASRLHPNEQETVCSSMHERKKMFADLSNAFVGLPGGYGTLEECMEMVTWTQLQIQSKPVVLLNVNGFYSPLRQFIEGAISSGFIAPSNRHFLLFVEPPNSDTDPSTFEWGQAALEAIQGWFEKGTGGGDQFQLDWKNGGKRSDLT